MAITTEQYQEVILKMQYRDALFMEKFNTALSQGKCTKELKKKQITFNYLLNVLRRYEPELEEDETQCLTEDQFCQIRNKLLTLLN
jgi:hypothetical protein